MLQRGAIVQHEVVNLIDLPLLISYFLQEYSGTEYKNNIKLLYINGIQMKFISICTHFLRGYIVRDYGTNNNSLNWNINSIHCWICLSHLRIFSNEHRNFYDVYKEVKLLVENSLKNGKEHIFCYSVEILCVKCIFVNDILDTNREVNNMEILEWIYAYLKIWIANWNIRKENGNLNCLFERWTFNFEWQRSWTIWNCLSQILCASHVWKSMCNLKLCYEYGSESIINELLFLSI